MQQENTTRQDQLLAPSIQSYGLQRETQPQKSPLDQAMEAAAVIGVIGAAITSCLDKVDEVKYRLANPRKE